MIFCYAVISAFLISGLIISAYNIYLFVKICGCPKIPAVIVDAVKSNNPRGTSEIKYIYKININGKEEIIDGPYNVSFNPFVSLISGFNIGKEVFVKYDKAKKKILPNIGNIIIYFVFGIIFILFSILGFSLLLLMF